MNDCVFCGPPSQAVVIDQDVYYLDPLQPVTPGHRLFIPFQHVQDATDEPYVTSLAFLAAAHYAKGFADANIITSIGKEATQTVFHAHVHVVPRLRGDQLPLPWHWQQRAATVNNLWVRLENAHEEDCDALDEQVLTYPEQCTCAVEEIAQIVRLLGIPEPMPSNAPYPVRDTV